MTTTRLLKCPAVSQDKIEECPLLWCGSAPHMALHLPFLLRQKHTILMCTCLHDLWYAGKQSHRKHSVSVQLFYLIESFHLHYCG